MKWEKLMSDLKNQFQIKGQSKYTKCECNTLLQYVLETGRVGCPKCYITFKQTLEQLVSQLKNRHCGKYPKRHTKKLEERIISLALEGRFDEIRNIKK
jgi:protein-arginine kinase activator protein McsA